MLILISDGALQSNKMLLRGCMSVSFLDGTCNAFSKQCPACNAVNLHLSMFFYVPMTHDSKKNNGTKSYRAIDFCMQAYSL